MPWCSLPWGTVPNGLRRGPPREGERPVPRAAAGNLAEVLGRGLTLARSDHLDTSVVLAQLLAEDHRPPASLWSETLVASRLMEYEVWTRLHARKLADSHGESARRLTGQIAPVGTVAAGA